MVLMAIGTYYTFYLDRIGKSMVKYVDLKQIWNIPTKLIAEGTKRVVFPNFLPN